MELTGKTLGRYQILGRIASGGMADVYRARQENLERYVAIKVLPPSLSRDPTFRARFDQEARAIARLHHPNILSVFDYGEQDGLAYIVMEYAPGGTLKDRMRDPVPLEETIDVICRVGSALAYAHRKGVVHRDVKPSNVLLTEDGWPQLSDFGLAKLAQDSKELTVSGVSIGTPEYMSPEQGQGLPIDHRSDIYSLGVLLFEMAVGRVPYEADSPIAVILKHITEPPPSPRALCPELPIDVETVILKAMSKEPDDRYANVEEMVQALERARENAQAVMGHVPGAVRAAPDSAVRPFKVPVGTPNGKRFPRWAAWVGLVLLAITVLGWVIASGLPGAVLPPATHTPHPTPTFTLAAVSERTTAPTRTPTPTPTFTATPAPSSTSTSTPTPTPIPQAIAGVASTVFEGPHSQARQLSVVAQGEAVQILGRADEQKFDRWLYVRTGDETEGYVYEPRFEYAVEWDSLDVREVESITTVAPPGPTLDVSPGPLEIVHIWPAGVCNEGGGWTAYLEIKLRGGDGKHYAVYWDGEQVPYAIKEAEPDVVVVERPGVRDMLLGTVRIESGDAQIEQQTTAKKPSDCG